MDSEPLVQFSFVLASYSFGIKSPHLNHLSRLRALSELEGPLQSHQSELHDLRELQEEQGGGENLYGELEAQWKETQEAFSDR